MIKFFRKIRQQLLTENKFRKYFLYAVGEIILVVIGILIALQINNWNQERLSDIEKKKLIENINTEFKSNREHILKIINTCKKSKSSSLELMKYVGNNQGFKQVVIDSLFDGMFLVVDYSPSDNAIDALVQSGKLNMLVDSKIPSMLAEWKRIIHLSKSREEKVEKWTFDALIPYLDNYVSWRDVGVTNNYNWSTSGVLKTNYNHIFNDLKFENILENHIFFINEALKRYKESIVIVDKIIQLTSTSKN